MSRDPLAVRLETLFEKEGGRPMPEAGANLVIYGAGRCGRDALRVLREGGYNVVAFLDLNAVTIGDIEGIPCHQPNSAASTTLARAGIPALIAVFNFATDTGAIEDALRLVGFERILPYHALDAEFPGALMSRFWLESHRFWEEHREELLSGLELWEDDLSREIYADSVELRLTGSLQLLRNPDRIHQYFPPDLPPPQEPVRFIDGGAYVGDTLAALERFHLEAVAAFEPDGENFGRLCCWFDDAAVRLKEAALFPCGLDSEPTVRRFQQGQGAGSAITDSGESLIQVVRLDDVLPRFAPTFIKLDIEGAEIDALTGATRMIRAHQPRIAACVYHRPTHLWEVPRLMRGLLPSHRLHLRYHGFNGLDVVAYAIEP